MRPVVLTSGDPAGVGIELALAAWARRAVCSVPPFVFLADPRLVTERAAVVPGVGPLPLQTVSSCAEAPAVFAHALPILPLQCPCAVQPGKPSPDAAGYVVAAIDRAVDLVMSREASAVVTNPIAKQVLYAAGFQHPGHTEYLSELAGRARPDQPVPQPVMLLSSDALNVVPLTIHVPIKDVPALISADLIKSTARIVHEAFVRDFGVETPRIAVSGLNPHAGEGGTIGSEEEKIIRPAIQELTSAGLDVVGPLSADTLFHAAARTTYDVALTMTHDQALIPIKTLAFDTAVNVTLGLPFVRTSPDHGTAFDIAGSGRASVSSLVAALRLADQMAMQRLARPPDLRL